MKVTFGVVFALMIGVAGVSAQQTPALPAPGTSSKVKDPKPKNTKAADSAGEKPAEEVAKGARPYVIGALDVLDISVWKDPTLSRMYDVRPDGMISMPLIGEIKADGLTVLELTKVIRDKLAATVTKEVPDVNIQPARINSQKIFMMGAVYRQGEMPLIGDMRVLDAISNCGGFKDFAKPKKIYVLRGEKRFEFNYNDVSKAKHMEQNILLENGDHIFVPE